MNSQKICLLTKEATGKIHSNMVCSYEDKTVPFLEGSLLIGSPDGSAEQKESFCRAKRVILLCMSTSDQKENLMIMQ